MLFVGAGQDIQQEIRDIVAKVKVGETGYVYVLGGKSELQKVTILIPKIINETAKNIRFPRCQGQLFHSRIVQNATLQKAEISYYSYPWKNSTDAEARMKWL
jgi:hypothetical protein